MPNKDYYQKNKEQLKSKRREYYALNKDAVLKQNMLYQKLNPDKIKAYQTQCYLKKKDRYIISAMLKKKEQIKNNIAFIKDILSHSQCLDCGCNIASCLDFHHIHNKRNTITIMKFNGCSIKTLKNEIEKCVIICSNCHRKRHAKKLNHANKKVQFVYQTKSSGCCAICSLTGIPQIFDFHHTRDKIDNINSMTHKKEYTLQDIILEIEKCIILCSNCHRKHHSESSSEENAAIGLPVNISSRFSNL